MMNLLLILKETLISYNLRYYYFLLLPDNQRK